MSLRLAFGLVLCASAARGEASDRTLMGADDFEAWSIGQTLDYWIDGTFFGSERHLPDRHTIDSDPGGPCVTGTWFPVGEAICFVYDGSAAQHCWTFWREGDQVFALSQSADPAASPATVTLAPEPLACPGPEVGA